MALSIVALIVQTWKPTWPILAVAMLLVCVDLLVR